MRRFFLTVAAMLVAVPIFAHGGHGRSVSFDDHDDWASTDCSSMSVRFDDQRVPVISEEVPIGSVSSLRVRAERNGGVRVVGSSRYAVTACKAVAPGVDPAQIRVNVNGSEVSGSGPRNEDWVLYFIVQTPRNASLQVESTNGPVSVYHFDGTLNARAENGPLSLKESSGTIVATTQNGPISLSGGSGNVKVSAGNGPLSVKLDGSAWDGNLEGSTQNGPVSLKLPRGYRSGVVLQSEGRAPVICKAEDCYASRQRAADLDDYPRKIELGSGAQNVRLSTVNGPISVKDRE